jgi:hypothetical protein
MSARQTANTEMDIQGVFGWVVQRRQLATTGNHRLRRVTQLRGCETRM